MCQICRFYSSLSEEGLLFYSLRSDIVQTAPPQTTDCHRLPPDKKPCHVWIQTFESQLNRLLPMPAYFLNVVPEESVKNDKLQTVKGRAKSGVRSPAVYQELTGTYLFNGSYLRLYNPLQCETYPTLLSRTNSSAYDESPSFVTCTHVANTYATVRQYYAVS
jgi:hypothetical protein